MAPRIIEWRLGDETDTVRLAAAIADRARPGDVIGLAGPLGVGKTRFARAFIERSIPCPSVYQEHGRKGDAVVEAARLSGAEGVVFAAPSFCDPALLEQPMAMAAVKDAGLPCTAFLYSENTGQYQVIREQAGTFADSIRLS